MTILGREYSMKVFASLIAAVLISSLWMAMLPIANADGTPTIYAPWGAAPTIDGIWSGTEWDNVPEYWLTGPGGRSYIRIKHDNSHLFIIIDSPWDRSLASVYDSENLWTAFDVAHTDGTDPQTDDWLFDNPHSSSQVDLEAWNGTGSGWGDPAFEHLAKGFYAVGNTRVPGPGLQPSPHSSTPHRIDEIKVPLEFAVKLCTMGGFWAMVVDDTNPSARYAAWPVAGNPNGWPPWDNPNPAPNTWGHLVLGSAPSVMFAPPFAVFATIDGIWSPGEWDDAPQYVMGGPSCQKGFIRAKFNQTHLLVLIDSPWDTTPSTLYYHENVWLAFDTMDNHGPAPLPDDFLIHPTTSWTLMGWQGDGAGWPQAFLGWAGIFACVQAGENFGAVPLQPSPNSAIPHRISELAVPLAVVGYPPSTVGFYVQVDDDSTDPDGGGPLPATSYAEWPLASGGTPGWPSGWGSVPTPAPMAWGDLVLQTPTIYAPPQVAPTIIDGIWSPGEWADTPQYIMKGPSCQKGFIRAKFNQTHLLVLIDSPWDTTPSTLYYHENVWLAFDTLNNGGPTPMPDDYLIHASTEFTQMGWQGNPLNGNWSMTWLGWAGTFACVQAGGNFGLIPLQPSPNSAAPHRISELAIPLALIDYSPHVGFYAQVDDDSTDPDGTGWLPPTSYAEWPVGSGGTPGWPGPWSFVPTPAPMAWGDLILAPPPAVHDVAVTLITPSKTIVGQALSCLVNVTVTNQGALAETFDVTLYEDDISLDTKSVSLASGGSTIVTFDWDTTGLPKDLLGCIMRAYAWPVLDEMDTMDNSRVESLICIAMPGDVAGGGGTFPNTLPDGRVEILDLSSIAIVYGIAYPDQRYVPNYDIDGNGRIEILDLSLAAIYYGRIDP